MQDGNKPNPDDVEIERQESSESIKTPVDPEAQLDEVARTPNEKAAGDHAGKQGSHGGAHEASPDDPDEAQSPT
ncbi:hypothetical protein ACFOWB_26435 [Chenggangzhangella methanolivorans]